MKQTIITTLLILALFAAYSLGQSSIYKHNGHEHPDIQLPDLQPTDPGSLRGPETSILFKEMKAKEQLNRKASGDECCCKHVQGMNITLKNTLVELRKLNNVQKQP